MCYERKMTLYSQQHNDGHRLEKENVDDPKNVEEDSRKRTGTITFELGSGCKATCRQDTVKDPCFCTERIK